VFSQSIGSLNFTCNTDKVGNPYQDCLNAQAAICSPAYISGNEDRINKCKNGVDKMFRSFPPPWQTVRKSCGLWAFDDAPVGSPNSLSCTNANIALQKNAFYLLPDGKKAPVTSALADSINNFLWRNAEMN
jgi:hypothetical protein